MKKINILAYVLSMKNSQKDIFQKYSKIICADNTKIIKMSEEKDLCSFVEQLIPIITPSSFEITSDFYFNFKIEQISKEFDLLRFGKNYIINIELKRASSKEKMEKQLIQNRHYLKTIDSTVYSYVYCSETTTLYFLKDSELIEITFSELIENLEKQELMNISEINILFKPSKFLISPFNSTEKFLNNQYYLTDHQTEIKNKIIKDTNTKYFSIEGNPGTGKTLLLYDIYKTFINDLGYSYEDLCIIHCGLLNEGHETLKSNSYQVIPVKQIGKRLNKIAPRIIFVDETQRIIIGQLNLIKEYSEENNAKCIFSFDANQTLADYETKRGIPEIIKKWDNNKNFRLTDKIRINNELSSFISNLFDLSKTNPNISYKNIQLQHLTNYKEANMYISFLNNKGYTFINFTPSQYYNAPFEKITCNNENCHSVIGQEFESVAVVIDKTFFYKNKKLNSSGWNGVPYSPIRMLYQAITRVRSQLVIIVIDNESVFHECLKIINHEI